MLLAQISYDSPEVQGFLSNLLSPAFWIKFAILAVIALTAFNWVQQHGPAAIFKLIAWLWNYITSLLKGTGNNGASPAGVVPVQAANIGSRDEAISHTLSAISYALATNDPELLNSLTAVLPKLQNVGKGA